MFNINQLNDLPLGFGMALAKNSDALKYFGSLDENQKKQVISQTQNISSKQEMQSYVNNLGKTVS